MRPQSSSTYLKKIFPSCKQLISIFDKLYIRQFNGIAILLGRISEWLDDSLDFCFLLGFFFGFPNSACMHIIRMETLVCCRINRLENVYEVTETFYSFHFSDAKSPRKPFNIFIHPPTDFHHQRVRSSTFSIFLLPNWWE